MPRDDASSDLRVRAATMRGVTESTSGVCEITTFPTPTSGPDLVDADAIEELRMTAKRHGVGIVACPAVVYEGLRLADPRERAKRATALAMRSWIRTMPEAYLESLELRREVGRLRPEWLIRHPDPVRVQKYRRNERDWRGDFWTRVRGRPDDMAQWIGGEERLDVARDHAKRVRRGGSCLGRDIRDT